jgi:RNA recognition motif-containing protein
MSYDYNELVGKISSSRRLAAAADGDEKIIHLQEAVDTFSALSTSCPMTPLLWMQYSSDTAELLRSLTSDNMSARETQIQLLELALAEFPGSAILHLRYLQVLSQDKKKNAKLKQALQTSIRNVGKGSHRNEGELIAAIYRLDAEQNVQTNFEDALTSYCQRACIPMRNVNDALNSEFQEFCANHEKQLRSEHLQLLENGRRYEAKIYSALVTREDEVDMAMHAGRILPRHQTNLEEIDWKTVLKSDNKTFWSGLGGADSAKAFIQYARACHRYQKPLDCDEDDSEIDEKVRALALCVFERGIAECPTVESIWLVYIQHLIYLIPKDDKLLTRLKSVVDRSVRNCPYSLPLYQHKIRNILRMASHGKSIMDPDEVMKIVKEALDAKFIVAKEACLELHMTAIEVLRRRILSLLASPSEKKNGNNLSYDDAEQINATLAFASIENDDKEEIEDLCDDLRELYDAVDHYLRKQFSSWSEGRSLLWLDRSYTESHLLSPLIESFRKERTDGPIAPLLELIRCCNKVTKIHQPSNPASFITYINGFLSTFPISSACGVLSKLRQVRCLYQNALKNTGKAKHISSVNELDYETSLRCLCHEYTVFERYFGSEISLAQASKAIKKKMTRTFPNGQRDVTPLLGYQAGATPDATMVDYTVADSISEEKKRSRDEEQVEQPVKKLKGSGEEATVASQEQPKKTNLSVSKPKTEKVKVGNLEYPAHPFTIRVSNIEPNTEDMNLVDTFRPRCGAIVHAKIVREKHHYGKGKSKGWGLIQFEEKESVEKALELSEILGIGEKLVKIERSNLPAVGLVPVGMHRVNPKGKGKSSKQNKKKSDVRVNNETPKSDKPMDPITKPDKESKQDESAMKHQSGTTNIFAFHPRRVVKGQKQRKPKVSLLDSKTEK